MRTAKIKPTTQWILRACVDRDIYTAAVKRATDESLSLSTWLRRLVLSALKEKAS